MRKTIIVSLLSNLSLFANNIKANEAMPWLLPWLISFIVLIAILFWLFYKAIKTKESKYRYWIIFVFVLMVVLSFV